MMYRPTDGDKKMHLFEKKTTCLKTSNFTHKVTKNNQTGFMFHGYHEINIVMFLSCSVSIIMKFGKLCMVKFKD